MYATNLGAVATDAEPLVAGRVDRQVLLGAVARGDADRAAVPIDECLAVHADVLDGADYVLLGLVEALDSCNSTRASFMNIFTASQRGAHATRG